MVKTVISHLVAFSALSLLVAGSLQYNPNSSMVWYFYGRQQKQFSSAMHCHQYFAGGLIFGCAKKIVVRTTAVAEASCKVPDLFAKCH